MTDAEKAEARKANNTYFNQAQKKDSQVQQQPESSVQPVGSETTAPKLPKPITALDCLEYPAKTFILGNLIQDKEVCVYAGKGKSGKSYTAENMALSMAARLEWLGMPTMKDVPEDACILWYNGDMSREKARRRLYECANGLCESFDKRNPHMFDRFFMIDAQYFRDCGCNQPLDFFSPANDARVLLKEFIKENKVIFTFVDTLITVEGGADENTADDMGEVMRNFQVMRDETGSGFFIIHHTGKDGSGDGRGSSAIYDGADNNFKLEKSDSKSLVKFLTTGVRDTAGDEIGIRHSWTQRKGNNGEPLLDDNGNPINIYRCFPADLDGMHFDSKTKSKETNHNKIKENIISLLSDGQARSYTGIFAELSKRKMETNTDRDTQKSIIKALIEDGKIEKINSAYVLSKEKL